MRAVGTLFFITALVITSQWLWKRHRETRNTSVSFLSLRDHKGQATLWNAGAFIFFGVAYLLAAAPCRLETIMARRILRGIGFVCIVPAIASQRDE